MLKNIRIIFSTIILFLFFFAFLNISNVLIIEYFLNNTQLIPLTIKIFLSGYKTGIFFLFVIILLTVLFGRVYCSFICPLGIMQDFFIFIKNKIKKTKSKYINDLHFLHYAFFIILIILFLFRKASLIGFLEPYAIFGKITSNVFLPAFSLILANLKIFILPEIHQSDLILFLFSIFILLIIVLLNIFFNRLYCNIICPTGAFLRLLSKKTIFNIKIDKDCPSCGICESQCKANCIDSKGGKIDNERCVRCFNCVSNCKKYLISFNKNKEEIKIDKQRREIIKGIFLFILFAFIKKNNIFADIIKTQKKNPLIIPPGSISLKNFNEKCISCHLCVASCPTKVLIPSFYEYGISGIFQPKMDYEKSYCLYECNICSLVCPTGAIKKISVNEKKQIQLGVAKFIKENCIVVNKETDCGVCSEFCPTKAVRLVHYKKDLYIPSVNEKICVGCGACENVCPAKPYRAIYIEGNKIHKKAELPARQKRERQRGNLNDEFPF